MSYFLSSNILKIGARENINGEEALHLLLSRRVRVGERIHLQGKDERRFEVEVTGVEKGTVKCIVLQEVPVPKEPAVPITLFQAFVKEKALDLIIQKATELGAAEVIVFESKHASFHVDDEAKKTERLNKISLEAAKQCDRVWAASVGFMSWEAVLEKIQEHDRVFVLDQTGSQSLASAAREVQASSGKRLGLCVGPEGGLTSDELGSFRAQPNVQIVTLGPRVLRADTAATAGLAILQALAGDTQAG